ncbi:hypothetical protein J4476_00015 [Candidatus Woesearchaeota archaeon]|nr:MAG: hypothetical protein QT09_C0008G0007 [archaeon GW2011_AR18]MBS3161068.1 hypothetical protein [Candidatus Woesearchaeota archaeon]HIH25636.1 hypothetical protein [Nanoarchaeota archaeon]
MKSDKRRKYFIDKYELRKLYQKDKLSMNQLKEIFKCSRGTIQFWLKKYKIKIRILNEANKTSRKHSIIITKDELQSAYNNCKSISKLSKQFNCKNCTIIKRLRDYDITHKFSNCRRFIIPKDKLVKLYITQKLTTFEIADLFGCSQAKIWKLLKKYNLKSRKSKDYHSNIPTKDILIKLYLNKKLSTWKIEKFYGYKRGTVHRKLKDYGIKLRSSSESHIIYKRKSFDKDIYEKVYLIGFRLGDLRVRKTGETIKTDCASTKPAQIELIKSLFNEYGRVWISEPRLRKDGKICVNIEAFLDLSFDFLLPKDNYDYILADKITFTSFLAGFTDAEGHIGIHEGQAVYSLGNYNIKLLKKIKLQLLHYLNIKSYIHKSEMTKYIRKGGYPYNSDYYQLTLSKKRDLLTLFDNIERFMKHEDKLNDIKEARNNIQERNEKFGYINM